MFDKAEEAESFEKLVERQKQTTEDIATLKEQAAKDPGQNEMYARQIRLLERHSTRLIKLIEARQEEKP